MSDEIKTLEMKVAKEFSEAAAVLDVPPPDPQVVARTRAAVRDEALRIRRRSVWRHRAASWVAAAAAILLAVGVRLPAPPAVDPLERAFAAADPVVLLDEWIDANYESNERFSALYNQTWWLSEIESEFDEAEIQSSLDDVEASFESFESILGA